MYRLSRSARGSRDLYADVERIAGLIQDEGFGDVAAELESRVAVGSTGTEILMSVADTLTRFMDTKPAITEALTHDAADLLRRIHRLLR